MKHLVISVSPDSSLQLLGEYADILLLDRSPTLELPQSYESVYIRSHFGRADMMPQNYRSEISSLVSQAQRLNPAVVFVDGMNSVDGIVAFEDKWHQYQLFSECMPRTELLFESDVSEFKNPIFKGRLSSRGASVTWDRADVGRSGDDWIVQESIDIAEELRIYLIRGSVYPLGAVRSSMTLSQKTQAVSTRELVDDEMAFASAIAAKVPEFDILGVDIARGRDGKLYLMEVNRSPGFAAFEKLANVNLASLLYANLVVYPYGKNEKK